MLSHCWLQAPQCAGSFDVATHDDPHRTYPERHTKSQLPLAQTATAFAGTSH
jgi:hypothetical protein